MKLVGVLGHITNDGYGVNSEYIAFARQFGNPIIIDANASDPLPIDILLLPGGRDVNPVRYGEAPNIYTQNPDVQYEWFYTQVFPKYIPQIKAHKTLVVGICAGFQNLNVIFGGKLNQHINQNYSSKTRGELVDDLRMEPGAFPNNFNIPEHYVTGKKEIKKGKEVSYLYNRWYSVNSLHHQGVYDNKYSVKFPHTLSEEFITMAWNRVFGNVEIMRHKELPIVAFQYHPEELSNNGFEGALINTMYANMINNFAAAAVLEDVN